MDVVNAARNALMPVFLLYLNHLYKSMEVILTVQA